MADEKQIYVSFEKGYYKLNKAELLKCQMNLVNLQKMMNHLKAIRANKKRYLAELNKKFSGMNIVLERLDTKMPEAGLPKHIKKKVKEHKKAQENVFEEKKVKIKPIKQVKDDEVDNLDKELLEIQRRLKELG